HKSDSHRSGEAAIFRGAHNFNTRIGALAETLRELMLEPGFELKHERLAPLLPHGTTTRWRRKPGPGLLWPGLRNDSLGFVGTHFCNGQHVERLQWPASGFGGSTDALLPPN